MQNTTIGQQFHAADGSGLHYWLITWFGPDHSTRGWHLTEARTCDVGARSAPHSTQHNEHLIERVHSRAAERLLPRRERLCEDGESSSVPLTLVR